ncbi:hypothetical protein ACO0QE_002135 [Hanseniaspora vineae]
MAKGSKLKQMLKDHKEVEKYNKEEQKRQQKAAKQLEEQSDAPVIVGKDDLIKAEEVEAAKKAEAENAASLSQSEEYKSEALSKKEKRQLKKQQKKEQEEQAKKEVVEEEKEDDDEDADHDDEEDEEYKQPEIDVERLARSDDDLSDSEEDEEDDEEDEEDEEEDDDEEEEQAEDAEEDVPLSEVEFDSDADIVPYQKVTINNKKALLSSLERISLPWEKRSFQEHQSVTSEKSTEESIKDIYNDTERELAFYKQSLEAVLEAKEKLHNLKVPFKRPLDYFAEMVKTDDHMDKLKQKMVQEASEKKAIEDARRQRNLKKFGKQVQVATLQQRQKEKRETLEKIKSLRKKRPAGEMGGASASGNGDSGDFNVAVEEAVFDNKRGKPQVSKKRAAKDAKYGFGGMKRFKRKNDAESSADMSGFSHKKMKGNNNRPGKSKRSRRN